MQQRRLPACVLAVTCLSVRLAMPAPGLVTVRVDTRTDPPRWAVLERQVLADNVPACREFFTRFFDDRGFLLCVERWGGDDDFNPATAASLVQLMMGGLPSPADGSLLNARLRYFDPAHRRAGIPDDVGALVSEVTDTITVVTLVNLNKTEPRTVVVQGGAYGEHQLESVSIGDKTIEVHSPLLTVQLGAGSGARLSLRMKRYANAPSWNHPWHR